VNEKEKTFVFQLTTWTLMFHSRCQKQAGTPHVYRWLVIKSWLKISNIDKLTRGQSLVPRVDPLGWMSLV
jgi:hypothetical protein